IEGQLPPLEAGSFRNYAFLAIPENLLNESLGNLRLEQNIARPIAVDVDFLNRSFGKAFQRYAVSPDRWERFYAGIPYFIAASAHTNWEDLADLSPIKGVRRGEQSFENSANLLRELLTTSRGQPPRVLTEGAVRWRPLS